MPAGLYIDFNDGGPPMVITAGMKGLKYVGSFYNGGPTTVYMPELNPAFPTYMMPYVGYRFIGKWVNGQVQILTGFNINGSNVTQLYGGNNQSGGSFAASVWQVDQTTPKSGLYISDSSDFTAFGNNLALGLCVYRGVVTINGSWTPPIPAGATGVTVFVKFNDNSKTLLYEGGAITCWNNQSGVDPAYQTVTAKVVIFAAGIEPTPQRGGLNMWNAAGRCTFSSGNRPFITYGGQLSINMNDQNTGGGMVQLCSTGWGFHSNDRGNTAWTKGMGLTMGNNTARAGWANLINKDTDWYSADYIEPHPNGFYLHIIPDIYI